MHTSYSCKENIWENNVDRRKENDFRWRSVYEKNFFFQIMLSSYLDDLKTVLEFALYKGHLSHYIVYNDSHHWQCWEQWSAEVLPFDYRAAQHFFLADHQ